MNVNKEQLKVGNFAEGYGFGIGETGGGCTALMHYITDDFYMMITDDAEVPESLNDSTTLGIYTDASDCIFHSGLETRFALYMGQRIANVIKHVSQGVELNFETADVASWLTINNLQSNNAWSDIEKAIDAIIHKGETQ